MQASFYIKGFLVFVMLTLTTDILLGQRAKVPSKAGFRIAQRHYAFMIDDMRWVDDLLESGIKGEDLDLITNENGYTALMLAVSYAINIDNMTFIPSISDADTWIEFVMDLLEAGASPTQPTAIREGFTTTPLQEVMNNSHLTELDIIFEMLFDTSISRNRINRITAALIQARDRQISALKP